MSWNIFLVEKECNQYITESYPLMKFFSLVENLRRYYEENERHAKKMRKK